MSWTGANRVKMGAELIVGKAGHDRSASKGARRRLIIDETVRIIGEKGYHGFSIQELAQACGLTNGGLLHHFGSKDQLLVAVLRDRDRRDEEAISAEIGLAGELGEDVPLDIIVQALRAIVARDAIQPELMRLYAMLRAEALNPAHPAYDYFESHEAAALEIFGAVLSPHVTDGVAAARQILALMKGLELQWLREKRGFDLVDAWDRSIASLLPESAQPVMERV
jgi:AcrR family transcriptional regulator